MTPPADAVSCAYCGLPVPAPWWRRGDEAAGLAYCCFGCRFAAEVTGAAGEEGQARWMLTRLGLAIFFAMNVMAFTMALWAHDVYPAADASPLSATLFGLFRYLCLFFTLPVLLLLGGPLADSAWQSLKRGFVSTDLLMLTGVAAAFIVSAVSVVRDNGPVYFEVACAVLVLVTLGRWFEARGKLQATQAIETLEKLLPDKVRLVTDSGETEALRSTISVGARLRVHAGERIPCDGVVLNHAVTVDEQLLTGESQGRVKEPGDPVHAGTLNLDGDLLLEVRADTANDTHARLVRLMRDARLAQGPYERLAERLARVFLPLVMLIAVVTTIVHARTGWDRGILAGLAVVLIACPCALGVATPLAVWAALGQAAKQGVLFRSGEVLERLATIRTIAFDKTGTLTTGQPRVGDWQCDPGTSPELLRQRTTSLAGASAHGLARALVEYDCSIHGAASSRHGGAPVRTLPGRGLMLESARVFMGSLRFMREQGQALAEPLLTGAEAARQAGRPLVAIAWEGRVCGLFVFDETLRPAAADVLRELQRQGLNVQVLTGDHRARGDQLSRELGVPVAAELLPEDKLAMLQSLRVVGPVAMVGDGINDSPALAAADVGIALGCGADVARAAAGVCLLSENLQHVPWAIDLARRTVRVVRQNLFLALVYNVLGIGLACSGRLNPVWAALAMTLSGSLVLMNSLRLTAR